MFADRTDAGRQLAQALLAAGEPRDCIVLGIPRGGVVVAAEVARVLSAPLDVVAAAKAGAPGNPEYAIGAVAPDGEVFANPDAGYSTTEVRGFAGPALAKVRHSLEDFRAGQPPLAVEGHCAIVVDDGLATGLTALAAVEYLRRLGAESVVLAVPVAPPDAAALLATRVDELVTLETPAGFSAVGQFYGRFEQTSDEDVARLLGEARERLGAR
jgi:putative phosphoribosyl transferase